MPDLAAGFELYRQLAEAAPQPHKVRVRAVTSQPRNGLPELPPYVYRGTGVDQLAGQYGDADLDAGAL